MGSDKLVPILGGWNIHDSSAVSIGRLFIQVATCLVQQVTWTSSGDTRRKSGFWNPWGTQMEPPDTEWRRGRRCSRILHIPWTITGNPSPIPLGQNDSSFSSRDRQTIMPANYLRIPSLRGLFQSRAQLTSSSLLPVRQGDSFCRHELKWERDYSSWEMNTR